MALPPILDDENLYKFRTKICERYVKQGKCEFADKCQYSHDLRWTRRPPWKYTYSPELCKDLIFVTDGRGRTIAKSTCKQKRNCKHSHTKEEQMYHPKIYKTVICLQYENHGWCDRYYCPFAHSQVEIRTSDMLFDPKAILPKTDQDSLCPDIYLPSDRPHPRLRARFLSIMDGMPHSRTALGLDPSKLPPSGYRTRHPYTDFISSHTPHSVHTSISSPTAAELPRQQQSVRTKDFPGQPEIPSNGQNVSRHYNALPQQNIYCAGNKQLYTKAEQQQTTQMLVQLLQAKQSQRPLLAAQNSREEFVPPLVPNNNLQTKHNLDSSVSQLMLTKALSSSSDPLVNGSNYTVPQATTPPCTPYLLSSATDRVGSTGIIFSSLSTTGLKGSVDEVGAGKKKTAQSLTENTTTGAFSVNNISGFGDGVHQANGTPVSAPTSHTQLPKFGELVATYESDKLLKTGTAREDSDNNSASKIPTQQSLGPFRVHSSSGFSVKCLSDDVCYWNEPIGNSRDDPSVLVFSGLLLGHTENIRGVVAVKQLPVVVTNRVGAIQSEMARFKAFSDPSLVNIRKVIFKLGERDEGTSLWVITDRCQGSLESVIPLNKFRLLVLQDFQPSSVVINATYQIITALHTLHQRSGSAHMRVHPGNIMISTKGDIRLGDCAGKIRYFSIVDLLCAGLQGARNAKALVQWILSTPNEICWMAPEMLRSLLNLSDALSCFLWNMSQNPSESPDERELSSLASACKWDLEFLQTADVWSLGATLFYILSGGFHPFGDISPATVNQILSGQKCSFETFQNSPFLADILMGFLCPDASHRLDLAKALCHPLFWQPADYEIYLIALYNALDDTNSTQSAALLDALSYDIHWVDSLASIPSAYPLLPFLLCYVSDPPNPQLLLSSHPGQTASSFLAFLGILVSDKRIQQQERHSLVRRCISACPAPFLHSVRLFLYPKVPPPSLFPSRTGRSNVFFVLNATEGTDRKTHWCSQADISNSCSISNLDKTISLLASASTANITADQPHNGNLTDTLLNGALNAIIHQHQTAVANIFPTAELVRREYPVNASEILALIENTKASNNMISKSQTNIPPPAPTITQQPGSDKYMQQHISGIQDLRQNSLGQDVWVNQIPKNQRQSGNYGKKGAQQVGDEAPAKNWKHSNGTNTLVCETVKSWRTRAGADRPGRADMSEKTAENAGQQQSLVTKKSTRSGASASCPVSQNGENKKPTPILTDSSTDGGNARKSKENRVNGVVEMHKAATSFTMPSPDTTKGKPNSNQTICNENQKHKGSGGGKLASPTSNRVAVVRHLVPEIVTSKPLLAPENVVKSAETSAEFSQELKNSNGKKQHNVSTNEATLGCSRMHTTSSTVSTAHSTATASDATLTQSHPVDGKDENNADMQWAENGTIAVKDVKQSPKKKQNSENLSCPKDVQKKKNGSKGQMASKLENITTATQNNASAKLIKSKREAKTATKTDKKPTADAQISSNGCVIQ